MRKVFPVNPSYFADIPAASGDEDGGWDGGELVELRDLRLRRKVRGLPALERRVIRWYFGLDGEALTTVQIAAQLGTSRQYVSKVKNRGLARLRESYGEVGYQEAMTGEAAAA